MPVYFKFMNILNPTGGITDNTVGIAFSHGETVYHTSPSGQPLQPIGNDPEQLIHICDKILMCDNKPGKDLYVWAYVEGQALPLFDIKHEDNRPYTVDYHFNLPNPYQCNIFRRPFRIRKFIGPILSGVLCSIAGGLLYPYLILSGFNFSVAGGVAALSGAFLSLLTWFIVSILNGGTIDSTLPIRVGPTPP